MAENTIQRSKRTAFVAILVLGVGGCAGDERPAALEASPVSLERSELLAKALKDARTAPPRTAEQVNDANPMGWLGRAHNRYQSLLVREWRASPRDFCGVASRLFLSGRWLGPDSVRYSATARRDQLPDAMNRLKCKLKNASFEGTNVAPVLPVSRSSTTLSGDPQPYLDAMEEALDSATTADEYAMIVDEIVQEAGLVLTGDELGLVQAGASIVVSSADYWEANIYAEYELIEPMFQSCQSIAEEPYPCDEQTSLRSGRMGRGTPVFLASNGGVAYQCHNILSWKVTARVDGAAALVGLVVTLNPVGALATGTIASANAFVGQGLAYFVCVAAS